MPPHVLDAIAPLIATFALGGFTLAGLKMYWSYKTRRLEIEGGRPSGKVDEVLDDLRGELHALRADVSELHERMDFAERLLTRGAGESGAPRPLNE